MKKMVCVLLVAVMVISMSVYATDEIISVVPETVEKDRMLVERFFLRDYTIWDEQGNDITSVFYENMMPAHRMADYTTIAEYVRAYVGSAEATEISETAAQGTSVLVTKYHFDWFFVDDLIHGRENHNAFSYEARLKYYYDAELDKITGGRNPDVYFCDLDSYFGDDPPVFEISNEDYAIAFNGSHINYYFDFAASIIVRSEDYPEADGLAYYYEGSVEVRKHAEP